jgi:hypothetical protein
MVKPRKVRQVINPPSKFSDSFRDQLTPLLWTVTITAFLVAIFLSGSDTNQNTDPHKGIVYLAGGYSKLCDGTTLVYTSGVVANSPECR